MKVWALLIAATSAAVLGSACGDDGAAGTGGGGTGGDVCAEVDCGGDVPTFASASLPWDLCTSCHSDSATVRQQNAVPDDSDYTTHAGVADRGELIAARVNSTGSDVMPPSGSTQLSAADKTAFTTWGCCGAPE